MRQGLEKERYVQVDGQWYFEVLNGFDPSGEPIYKRNPTPTQVDLLGERRMVPAGRNAIGEIIFASAIVRHPTHTIDANGRLQKFHPPGQGERR